MSSILSDPHNHAPDVTPDDEWGDADGVASQHGAFAILPPKRARNETSQTGVSDDSTVGLRIDSRMPVEQAEPTVNRIEVVKLDATVVRLNPTEPSVARAPRQIVFHEVPAGYSTTRPKTDEAVEWGRTKNFSFRWIVGIPLIIGLLVGTSVLLLPLINRSDSGGALQADLVLEPEVRIDGIKIANDLLTREPEAEQLYRTYASSHDGQDVLPVIRDASTLAPLVLASHRTALVPGDWIPPSDLKWLVTNGEKYPYAVLEGPLPDYSKFCAYFILSENHLLLDWKATTGYGTATFSELAENRGNSSEIRGTIVPTEFYTGMFPESDYRSFQLISPDNQKAIWCYTRRNGPADTSLSKLFLQGEILDKNTAPEKVTLRLEQAPAGALANQWLIASLLHPEWISPDLKNP